MACVALLLGGLTACEPSPVGQQRAQYRREALAYTLDAAARSEEVRPARLARVGPWIDANERRHAEWLERDGDVVAEWIQRDVDRMPTRQRAYQQKIDQVLRGKPENIERSAIILFY